MDPPINISSKSLNIMSAQAIQKLQNLNTCKHEKHNIKCFEYTCRWQLLFEISEAKTKLVYRLVFIFNLDTAKLTFIGSLFFVNYTFCHMFAHQLILILNHCRSHNSIRWQIAAVINLIFRLTDDWLNNKNCNIWMKL